MPTATRTRSKPTKRLKPVKSPNTIALRVQAYIDGVLSGKIVACKYVRQAVERHVRDLRDGPDRGLVFREGQATLAIKFIECLPHSKGKWAGQPLHLEPWQCFIFWCVFGWYRQDGRRRFNSVFISVARKNGKSTVCAGVALKTLVCDGENGAEIYSAATKKDQAKIVWSEARKMVLKSPSLKKLVTAFRDSLVVESTESTYKPLGKDADTLDGLNPHCTVIDEVHAHKTRDVWDVIESGTGARDNPLTIGITTAGDGKHETIYAELKKRTEDVLSGRFTDDTWFGIIFTLDEERTEIRGGQEVKIPADDWRDEKVWIKANPNLGVSVNIEDLRRLAQKAQESPSSAPNFRRKRCNQDIEAHSPWITTDDGSPWQECCGVPIYGEGGPYGLLPGVVERFAGKPCWAGGDLSSLSDLTALAFAFPAADGFLDLLVFTWCPRENAIGRTRDKHVPYLSWAERGLITLTEGDSVDYDTIRELLRTARDTWKWDIKQLAFDPNNARYLLTKLVEEDGFTAEGQVMEHGQTTAYMNEPIGVAEKLILDRKLRHGGHPVLRWCVSNCVIYQDTGSRRRFNKKKAREKIDLAVASVMAIGRALAGGAGVRRSVYESRGLLSV